MRPKLRLAQEFDRTARRVFERTPTEVEPARARVAAAYAVVFVLILGVFGLLNLLRGDLGAAAVYGGSVALQVLLVLRLRRHFEIFSMASVALAYATALWATVTSGGMRDSNAVPFLALALVSVFLLGGRGYILALLGTAGSALVGLVSLAGYEFPSRLQPGGELLDSLFTTVVMGLACLAIIGAYERERVAARQRKDTFLTNVSHELRAPLQVLSTVLDLLPLSPPGARRQQLVETARAHTVNLSMLVEDLLDLARSEQQGFPLRDEPFDLTELLRGQVQLIGAACEDADLSLRVELDADLPRWVHGDERRLRQVLLILSRNAISFTERGEIGLVAGRVPGSDHLRFEVQDTGVGIVNEQIHRVFERFYQVDSSMTREHGGPGLGLAVFRDIVTAMGGQVGVHSAPSMGSRFWFEIPAREVAAPEELPQLPAALADEPMDDDEEPSLRVVVADDNDMARDLMTAIVGLDGHDVRGAVDGREALHLWRELRPHVLFLDVEMPNMSGPEVARALRGEEGGVRRTRVVGTTGHSGADMQARCLAAGMDEVLVKPFDPAEIQELLAGMRR